jgi:hypothetical protein
MLLYKYRSFDSYGLKEIFTKRELFFSKPSRFNDPFDCRPNFTINPGADLKKITDKLGILEHRPIGLEDKELFSLLEKAYIKEMNSRIDNQAILSLSKVWDRILMWSHYSQNHTGLCLGFDFSTSKNHFFSNSWEVDYDNQNLRPEIKLDDCLKQGKERGNYFLNKKLLSKHQDWTYENEVRCIAMQVDKQMEGVQSFEAECIKEVILGVLVSEENELITRHWVAKYTPHVKITKLAFSKKLYAVEKID